MSAKNNLIREMQRIAARILRNTRGVPKNMGDKVELIDLAFGRAEILADFEKWCEDSEQHHTSFPVTEYLRGIDARLGNDSRVAPDDDRVSELRGLTFNLTQVMPRLSAVRSLLALHSLEEIKEALTEFLPTVAEGNMEKAMRNFYDDLGATAVIYVRRNRK
jgi:hypothetical protein